MRAVRLSQIGFIGFLLINFISTKIIAIDHDELHELAGDERSIGVDELCKRALSLVQQTTVGDAAGTFFGTEKLARAWNYLGLDPKALVSIIDSSSGALSNSIVSDRLYEYFHEIKNRDSYSSRSFAYASFNFFNQFEKANGKDATWSRILGFFIEIGSEPPQDSSKNASFRDHFTSARDSMRTSLIGTEQNPGQFGFPPLFSPLKSSDPTVTLEDALLAYQTLREDQVALSKGDRQGTYLYMQLVQRELEFLLRQKARDILLDHSRDPLDRIAEVEILQEQIDSLGIALAQGDKVRDLFQEYARSKAFDPVKGLPNMKVYGTYGSATQVMQPNEESRAPTRQGYSHPTWKDPTAVSKQQRSSP